MEEIETVLGGERDAGRYVYEAVRRGLQVSGVYKVLAPPLFWATGVDVGIMLLRRVWEGRRVLLR